MISCKKLLSFIFILFGITAFHPTAYAQIDREAGPLNVTRSEVIAKNGMVATSQPLATTCKLGSVFLGATRAS